MIIHTNADVDQPIYLEDRDGDRITIDPDATYRFALKKHREDTNPATGLTFDSGVVVGPDTAYITIENGEIDGKVSDYFRLRVSQAVVATLTPGAYFADMITTAPLRQNLFDVVVEVSLGISPA